MLGRVVLDEQGIFSAYYMAFFIFIMTYFFLNILLGFLVDNMSPESKEFPQTIILQKEIPDEDDRKIVNIWRKMAFGDFTDKIIFITFLLSWIEIHTFVNQNDFLGDIAIFFELTMDFIYIMNFYLWVVSYSFFQNKPYVYVYIFVIKLLAGPLAFGLDFSYFMSSQAYFIG